MGLKTLIQNIIFFLLVTTSFGQEIQSIDQDSSTVTLKDSLIHTIKLKEVTVASKKNNLSADKKKQIRLLIRRVHKVYPYAKIAGDRYSELNRNLNNLKRKKDKKKYLKLVEKYMMEEHEDRLRHFSRKEGQILTKLIYRQLGITTFDMIEEFKSSWTAFWYNKAGKLYDVEIKTKYNPKEVQEDYIIEQILYKGFRSGKLKYQAPHTPIDLDELAKHWSNKKPTSSK